MDDQALVAALVSGDPRGLERAYRRYADRLYAYCRGLLHDPETAADVVHDTFVLASKRAVQLREPDRLRAWLYAIARNECLRHGLPAPPAAGEPDETVELVWTAVAGLQPREREVFELVVRHELPAQEVSDVLGISVAQAHDRLARARAQLAEALGQPDPAALFAAYAAAPFPDVPAELWPRLELKCFDPGLDLERDAILERAGRFDPATGFPRPRDVQRRRRLVVTGVTAVAVAAVAAAIAGAAIPPLRSDPPPQAQPSAPAVAPVLPSPAPTASASPSRSPSPSPSTPAPPPPPPPSTSVPGAVQPLPPPPRPSLTVDASAEADCFLLVGYELVARASASQPLAAAELFVQAGGGGVESYPMEVDGDTASGRSDLHQGEAQWWVAVTTADDERAETEPEVTPDC
jgi:DNA-directed RNA polymerase specialized sigma24 family protein